MKAPPIVSVLMPVFEAKATLERAIESILAQDFAFELVIVLNNSDSETRQIAESYNTEYDEITLINESIQGIAYALNAGLQKCQSEFIARMDADDVMLPGRLNHQFDFLQSNPAIAVVGSKAVYKSTSNETLGYQFHVDGINEIVSEQDILDYRFIESPLAHPSVMFRKSVILEYGGYSTKKIPEDYELWLRLLSKSIRIAKTDFPAVIWNDHTERASRILPHYSVEAFNEVKMHYLKQYILSAVNIGNTKLILLGAGKKAKRNLTILESDGIQFWGISDLKHREIEGKVFIPFQDLSYQKDLFLVSMVSNRGAWKEIDQALKGKGFQRGKNYVLAT